MSQHRVVGSGILMRANHRPRGCVVPVAFRKTRPIGPAPALNPKRDTPSNSWPIANSIRICAAEVPKTNSPQEPSAGSCGLPCHAKGPLRVLPPEELPSRGAKPSKSVAEVQLGGAFPPATPGHAPSGSRCARLSVAGAGFASRRVASGRSAGCRGAGRRSAGCRSASRRSTGRRRASRWGASCRSASRRSTSRRCACRRSASRCTGRSTCRSAASSRVTSGRTSVGTACATRTARAARRTRLRGARGAFRRTTLSGKGWSSRSGHSKAASHHHKTRERNRFGHRDFLWGSD